MDITNLKSIYHPDLYMVYDREIGRVVFLSDTKEAVPSYPVLHMNFYGLDNILLLDKKRYKKEGTYYSLYISQYDLDYYITEAIENDTDPDNLGWQGVDEEVFSLTHLLKEVYTGVSND